MKEFIEVLQILMKYDNPDYPFHCEHDVLYIGVDPEKVSEEDIAKLKKMGIYKGEDEYSEGFYSYKYGSC